MAAWRVWLLGLLAVAMWALAIHGAARPTALGVDAPAEQFSAARARGVLTRLLGDQKPHPAGSAENAAVRARLLGLLRDEGIAAQTLSGMSCRSGRGAILCGTVSDVIAEALPGEGKAIVLMAHLDSVAAGPGASDDASGVATIVETIRALKAQPGAARHPVIALFTDGEELGLLGASLFLRDPAWAARVGVVVNVEARGTRGVSYLFQTSAGDGKLVDLYARSVARPATSSLYGEIYKYLPNDTDLTPFLKAGFAGYNFAFIGGVAGYHTGGDTIGALDPVTLQSHGDNVLGLVRGLQAQDFSELGGGDAIYFDILGRWLPRLPVGFALPLALLAFAGIALAGWKDRFRPKLAALLMPPLLLLGCLASGFLLHGLAAWISGEGNPSFAHPMALRIGLAFGCWGMALLVMPRAGAIASWLWLAGLGVVAAIFAPGLSPYFIFPSLLAALLLLLSMGLGRGFALLVSVLAALLVFVGFAANGEAIMGLAAHPLFTVPVGLGLIALLPLLARADMGAGCRRASLWICAGVAIGCAVMAGFQPAYSAAQPQRLNLRYVEKSGNAWVLADPVDRLPEALRAAAPFSQTPQRIDVARGYAVLLGGAGNAIPEAGILRRKNRVTLELYGSAGADGMALIVPEGLSSVTIAGQRMVAPPGPVLINCATRDCARLRVDLEFSGAVPGRITLVEQRRGLPPKLDALKRARPDWAVPSQGGDMTSIAADMFIPGGF